MNPLPGVCARNAFQFSVTSISFEEIRSTVAQACWRPIRTVRKCQTWPNWRGRNLGSGPVPLSNRAVPSIRRARRANAIIGQALHCRCGCLSCIGCCSAHLPNQIKPASGANKSVRTQRRAQPADIENHENVITECSARYGSQSALLIRQHGLYRSVRGAANSRKALPLKDIEFFVRPKGHHRQNAL